MLNVVHPKFGYLCHRRFLFMIKHGDRFIWAFNGKGGGYIFLSPLIKFPVLSLNTVNYFIFW